jgi:branched-chain amino acid transport system permease protein
MSLVSASPAAIPVERFFGHVGSGNWALLAALIVYPLMVPPFFAFQIGAQILILGMIGLSLMVLAGWSASRSLRRQAWQGTPYPFSV